MDPADSPPLQLGWAGRRGGPSPREPRGEGQGSAKREAKGRTYRGAEGASARRGMWNSRKVGEWIERRTGRGLANKKQRGWEYLKRIGQSPKKAPRPHHAEADAREQEAFKKGSP